MNNLLTRFWLEIDRSSFGYDIGVTAFNEDDIKYLLSSKLNVEVKINSIQIIKSIKDLEQNHVVPNMEEFVSRGIWYPKGYK